MSCQFVRSRESFEAAGEVTLMGFLPGMRSDVPCLVFQPVEPFLA